MNTLLYKQNICKDPFAETPVPPSHYHPTLQRSLTTKDKQTRIQPILEEHSKQVKTKVCSKLSPKEKTFLDKGHVYISRELPTHDTPSPGNNSSKFDESWPSSERPSTLDSPYNSPHVAGYDNQACKDLPLSAYSKVLPFEENARNFAADDRWSTAKLSLISSEKSSMKGHSSWQQSTTRSSLQSVDSKKPATSTIAKYIDRFRYGEPSSREDRKRDKNDFWWLQTSDSPSSAFQTSTPTDADSERGRRMPTRARQANSPVKDNRTSGSSSSYLTSGAHYESDRSSFLAPDSTDIQSRANALIERSESSFSNESIISCQPSNLFPIPSHDPVSVQRPAATEYRKRRHFPMQSGSSRAAERKIPEDDILYQWRLRRKLEQARDKSTKWAEPIPMPSSRPNLQHQSVAARSKEDVDSKLTEFRERLRNQEHISSLGLPHPSKIETSYAVKTVGNDPIPQTIATQTNGMLQGRPVDQCHVGEPGSDETVGTVRIASPKHHVHPHLHMSCDIIPCHDVEHTRGREKTEFEDVRPGIKPHIDDGSPSGIEKRHDIFADEKDVGRGKRGRTIREALHRAGHDNITQRETLHGAEYDNITQRETLHTAEHDNKTTRGTLHGAEHDNRSQEEALYGVEQMVAVQESQDELTQVREHSIDDLDDTIVNTAVQAQPMYVASSPISSTIGKVVSDRLFSTPQQSVSPCSSVQSLPSMHSITSQKDSGNEVKPDVVSVSDDASSGEFSDDELLQVLRQKRETFEEELREIDQRLSGF